MTTATNAPHRHAVGTVVFGNRRVRGASDRQAAFIDRLLAARQWDALTMYRMTGIHNPTGADINLRAASDVITYLLQCPTLATAPARPATDRQVEYVRALATARCMPVPEGPLTFDEASDLITRLKAIPVPTPDVQLVPGAYRVDGVVYSVRIGRESRRLQAYRFTGTRWEWTRGVVARLRPDMRLTLEEAMTYGAQTGQCCHCGAPLTDPKSVARGIGPVCATKY